MANLEGGQKKKDHSERGLPFSPSLMFKLQLWPIHMPCWRQDGERGTWARLKRRGELLRWLTRCYPEVKWICLMSCFPFEMMMMMIQSINHFPFDLRVHTQEFLWMNVAQLFNLFKLMTTMMILWGENCEEDVSSGDAHLSFTWQWSSIFHPFRSSPFLLILDSPLA